MARGVKAGLEERVKNTTLVKAREAIGMTQEEAAEAIGIGKASLCNYENMISYPSSGMQERICGFYRQNGQFLEEKSTFPEYMSVIAVRHRGKGISVPSIALSSVNESYQIDVGKIDAEIIINELMKDIPGRGRDILIKRYGLDGDTPKTFLEVAKEQNISRERVRQIEEYAIKKLRKKAMGEKEKI